MNTLEQLKKYTIVVADTGDFELIEVFRPVDATTNPSLILQAASDPRYGHLAEKAAREAQALTSDSRRRVEICLDRVAVNFGLEILKIVPGRVSTEVDARLSFDTGATLARAREIIRLYETAGIDRARILIKIAATWEGIRAAAILEKEGIHCNLTLLFSFIQAVACADAGVTLISPFVGRILDWHKKERNLVVVAPEDDPGVVSVTAIYHYYKKFGYSTQIMGASFRNTDEIIALAGCDLLTIAPHLLKELGDSQVNITRRLDPAASASMTAEKVSCSEEVFRWELNEDAMATHQLADGIRRFTADIRKLEKLLAEKYLNR